MKYYTHKENFPYASFSEEDKRYFFFYKKDNGEVGYLFCDTAEHVPADSHFSRMIHLLISKWRV